MKPQSVTLPELIKQQMLEHAIMARREEACGLVGFIHDQANTYYPVKNIAKNKSTCYLMDPQEQIDSMRKIRDAGEIMRGIFHSHPDGPAQPSATDLEQAAYPDTIYFICSPMNKQHNLSAYYYNDEQFDEISIIVK